MTIKALAYSAQQYLQATTGSSFKRAHIYELLAASFSFNSYAAFGIDAVFMQRQPDKKRAAFGNSVIRQRCVDLGYQPQTADLVSSALPAFLLERLTVAVRISDLVGELRSESLHQKGYVDEYEDEQADDDQTDMAIRGWGDFDKDDVAPITLEGLEGAASRGVALGHYALALIYAPDEEPEAGSDYWYSQAQQGRIMTGVQKEWANAHSAYLTKEAKYAYHLREAARLGHQDALLDIADRFDDPAFFEQADSQINADPVLVAEIAERLGRPNDTRKWLTVAAEAGDTEAMRQLINDYDYGDLRRCWTWIYLAELVGIDLTKDEHYAINKDGFPYDDDVGGNAFVGGRGGIDLIPLSAELDVEVRCVAQEIFKRMK